MYSESMQFAIWPIVYCFKGLLTQQRHVSINSQVTWTQHLQATHNTRHLLTGRDTDVTPGTALLLQAGRSGDTVTKFFSLSSLWEQERGSQTVHSEWPLEAGFPEHDLRGM